jgi:hypothetical protein
MQDKVILDVRTPRTGEETPEAMVQFLSSLTSLRTSTSFFRKKGLPISLEIATFDQTIHFFIVIPKVYQAFLESQLLSQYPKAIIAPTTKDYLLSFFENSETVEEGRLRLEHGFAYPIKTYKDFKNIDPLSSLLGNLSKTEKGDRVLIQFLLIPISHRWQKKGHRMIEQKAEQKEYSRVSNYSKEIGEKINQQGFKVGIRVVTNSSNPALLNLVEACFSSFNNPGINSLIMDHPYSWQKKKFNKSILEREDDYIPNSNILNLSELSTMFHFPTAPLSNIQTIAWTKSILSEPPENLPVATGASDEEKKEINFYARTNFKNKPTVFGIKKVDRRRHVYIIGKTGTGKSTLIANMVINDIRNGEGVAIIDPHGDLCETILDYIPSYRINDVVYLNPADLEHPFSLNPLEVSNHAQKELVSSGIVAIFYKLYAQSWGPRLEYILRNCILTLLEVPNPTMLMIPELLTNPKFRHSVVAQVHDQVLRNFWLNEFENMPDKLRSESISPILNKVGQFLSSQVIRSVVGSPKSTINLEDIMNSGKILIVNLSQGRLGEDNSALLGAMTITKLQLAAMNRVDTPEADRKDFYLYVDEFQNFATTSFIKILSEARKYHLNLIVANQYTAQTSAELRSAIFGNVGTLVSFLVGAEDASYLTREFKERFKEEDLLSLGNYQILLKLAVEGLTTSPFYAQTLPLPASKTQNREKAIRSSQERYSKKSKETPREAYNVAGYSPDPSILRADNNTSPEIATGGTIVFNRTLKP